MSWLTYPLHTHTHRSPHTQLTTTSHNHRTPTTNLENQDKLSQKANTKCRDHCEPSGTWPLGRPALRDKLDFLWPRTLMDSDTVLSFFIFFALYIYSPHPENRQNWARRALGSIVLSKHNSNTTFSLGDSASSESSVSLGLPTSDFYMIWTKEMELSFHPPKHRKR